MCVYSPFFLLLFHFFVYVCVFAYLITSILSLLFFFFVLLVFYIFFFFLCVCGVFFFSCLISLECTAHSVFTPTKLDIFFFFFLFIK